MSNFNATEAFAQDLARAALEGVNSGDLDAIVAPFAADVIVRFGDFPEMRGRDELKAWYRKRMARAQNYVVTSKSVRVVHGSIIGNRWTAEWFDPSTDSHMNGVGTEFWEINDEGLIQVWEASFNVWSPSAGPASPLV